MPPTLSEIIDSGIAAQQSGKLHEALQYYESALELAAEDAEVLSLLGLVLCQLDRLDEAEPLLRDAVKREPQEIGFHMNLVELLCRRGMLDEAKNELHWAVNKNTKFLPGWERLGDIALSQQDILAAEQVYVRAFSIDRTNFNIGLKLAEVHIILKQYEQAIVILKNITNQQPENPTLFKLMCSALLATQNWPNLEAVSKNWTTLCADEPTAWVMLCTALMEQGRYRLAEESFHNVLENRSENAEDLSVYGQICLQCFEYDRARTVLARAEELDPNRTDVLVSISLIHTYYGKFKLAEDYCRRALRLDEYFIPAYIQLGHLNHGLFDESEMERLQDLNDDSGRPFDHRIDIAFTLGRAYEAKAKYQSAIKTYMFANSLCQIRSENLNIHYNKNDSVEKTLQLKLHYKRKMTQPRANKSKPCPIFIVGMPRSGTTLVESTIAAHSSVFAGGERPLLPQINDAVLSYSTQNNDRLPPQKMLEDWANAYLTDIPDIGDASHFTDKNPINIESVGLISILFPNAPIIHIRRNPIETCLSIFKHNFSKFWPFAHSPLDTAHYYSQYTQLVAYWEKVLGDKFLTIQYESFAKYFSTMAPILLEHCELEWEAECLNFQSANRAISTLSAVQVREPIKVRESIAENFNDIAELLSRELIASNVDLKTGALIEAGKSA